MLLYLTLCEIYEGPKDVSILKEYQNHNDFTPIENVNMQKVFKCLTQENVFNVLLFSSTHMIGCEHAKCVLLNHGMSK